ncbi:MAG: TIGR03067 domain-containing protein [Gemmataceae bacterium]
MVARTVFFFAVLVLIAAERPAKDTKKDLAKKDLDKLQGEWTMVSKKAGGWKAPDENIKNNKLTIKGDQWAVRLDLGEFEAPGLPVTFKIDPSKKPKLIDLVREASGRKYLLRGIYKLEGDTLTVCIALGNLPRPKQFKTTARAVSLEVWKKQAPPPPAREKK